MTDRKSIAALLVDFSQAAKLSKLFAVVNILPAMFYSVCVSHEEVGFYIW